MRKYPRTLSKITLISSATLIFSSCLLLQACGSSSASSQNPPDSTKINLVNSTNDSITFEPTQRSDSCFSDIIPLTHNSHLKESIANNCSAKIAVPGSIHDLDFTVVNGKITSPTGISGEVYANISSDKKTLTFEFNTQGTINIDDQVQTGSTTINNYSPNFTISGDCFTEKITTISSSKQNTILNFNPPALHGIDGCTANFTFNSAQCPLHFNYGKASDQAINTFKGCSGLTDWKQGIIPKIISGITYDDTKKQTGFIFANPSYVSQATLDTMYTDAFNHYSSPIEKYSHVYENNSEWQTSESVSIGALTSALMMEISVNGGSTSIQYDKAKSNFMDNYNFALIKSARDDNGLLRWSGHKTWDAGVGSATDGDFYLAFAEYLAADAMNIHRDTGADSILTQAQSDMHAIYMYDFTTVPIAASQFSGQKLPTGGDQEGSWIIGKPGKNTPPRRIELDKALLPAMLLFNKVKGTTGANDHWNQLITNDLNFAQAFQTEMQKKFQTSLIVGGDKFKNNIWPSILAKNGMIGFAGGFKYQTITSPTQIGVSDDSGRFAAFIASEMQIENSPNYQGEIHYPQLTQINRDFLTSYLPGFGAQDEKGTWDRIGWPEFADGSPSPITTGTGFWTSMTLLACYSMNDHITPNILDGYVKAWNMQNTYDGILPHSGGYKIKGGDYYNNSDALLFALLANPVITARINTLLNT